MITNTTEDNQGNSRVEHKFCLLYTTFEALINVFHNISLPTLVTDISDKTCTKAITKSLGTIVL